MNKLFNYFVLLKNVFFFGVFELVTVTITLGCFLNTFCLAIYPFNKLLFVLLWFVDTYVLSFVIILDMVEFMEVNFELADLNALSFIELVLDKMLVFESNEDCVDIVLVDP